jgi:RimJ/RimL family protein N-acetyltransferase
VPISASTSPANTSAIAMAKRKGDALDAELISGPSNNTRSTLIEDLNALDRDAFVSRFLHTTSRMEHEQYGTHWRLAFTFARHLSSAHLAQYYELIKSTSRHDYEPSSFGWHPQRKKKEMKEDEMRYIRVEKNEYGNQFGGFISFMFTHDSSPAVPVLYIYEIHLTEAARGKGVGGFLMRLVDGIAKEAGVEKVMLTCFLSNENALAFYKKFGFEVDACSPGDRRMRNKVVKSDYVIMSKDVSKKENDGGNAAAEVNREMLNGTSSLPNANTAPQGNQLNVASSSTDNTRQTISASAALEIERGKVDWLAHKLKQATDDRDLQAAGLKNFKHSYDEARRAYHGVYESEKLLKKVLENERQKSMALKQKVLSLEKKGGLTERLKAIEQQLADLEEREEAAEEREYAVKEREEEAEEREYAVKEREEEAEEREDALERYEALEEREQALEEREDEIEQREQSMEEEEHALAQQEEAMEQRAEQLEWREERMRRRENEEYYQRCERGEKIEEDWEGDPRTYQAAVRYFLDRTRGR